MSALSKEFDVPVVGAVLVELVGTVAGPQVRLHFGLGRTKALTFVSTEDLSDWVQAEQAYSNINAGEAARLVAEA